MPRYNVEADGEWACFSSVVDAFITHFMPLEEYEKWRVAEYEKSNVPLAESNKRTLKECLFSLSLNKSADEIYTNLVESGLMYQEGAIECRSTNESTSFTDMAG
jgi:hypothetical protein